MPISRGVYEGIEPEVVQVLESARFYLGDQNVDDEDAGLAYQYKQGILDIDALKDIVARQERLVRLIQNRQFVP